MKTVLDTQDIAEAIRLWLVERKLTDEKAQTLSFHVRMNYGRDNPIEIIVEYRPIG